MAEKEEVSHTTVTTEDNLEVQASYRRCTHMSQGARSPAACNIRASNSELKYSIHRLTCTRPSTSRPLRSPRNNAEANIPFPQNRIKKLYIQKCVQINSLPQHSVNSRSSGGGTSRHWHFSKIFSVPKCTSSQLVLFGRTGYFHDLNCPLC